MATSDPTADELRHAFMLRVIQNGCFKPAA